jgi:hypothetical protein
MALVGRLEDLQLTELFHVLSLFKKSGRLTLSHGDENGVFLFNKGKIFHASNGSTRPFLGAKLIEQGLITEETLEQALAVQKHETEWRKLGAVLVEMGALTREMLEDAVRQELQDITEHFLHWDSGFFSFKPVTPDGGTAESPHESELADGIDTDHFVLEMLTRVDEVGGSAAVTPSPRSQDLREGSSGQKVRKLLDYMVDPGSGVFKVDPADAVTQWPDDLAELRTLMTEIQLRPTSFTGEIALLILRYATRVVNRGALFGVTSAGISGIGQFGIGGAGDSTPQVDRRIRQIVIPANEPSVFFEVIERMSTYHGALKPCSWNNYLVDQLGGSVPPEVVAVPIVVEGMIAAIFYGDNLPGEHPITAIHGLELLMIESGLALEKNLLRERLRGVEDRLRAVEGEIREDGGVTE